MSMDKLVSTVYTHMVNIHIYQQAGGQSGKMGGMDSYGLVCVMSVYGPQMGRTGAEKQEFRDALERMVGMVEMDIMLCIMGD